jgi:hypothetical protein
MSKLFKGMVRRRTNRLQQWLEVLAHSFAIGLKETRLVVLTDRERDRRSIERGLGCSQVAQPAPEQQNGHSSSLINAPEARNPPLRGARGSPLTSSVSSIPRHEQERS